MSTPRIISHRANSHGPGTGDNHPTAIRTLLAAGYDVELDVWDAALDLGHDAPTYRLPRRLDIANPHIWWHCKNHRALNTLIALHAKHILWHQNDDIAITTSGYLWCHTNVPHPHPKSIILLLNNPHNPPHPLPHCHAICTDYPHNLRLNVNNANAKRRQP